MCLIIGVGNEYRGDDAAGLVVARALRGLALPVSGVLESAGETGELIEAWRNADRVFVIDAARSGAAPGTIFRVEPLKQPMTLRMTSHTTHDLGLAEAIELARALERLPGQLVVYAIEGGQFTPGAALSPPVERACREVIARVAAEVR